MKKLSVLIILLTIVISLISCNKQKHNTFEKEKSETVIQKINTIQTSTLEAADENQNENLALDDSDEEKQMSIIPGKDGQPDEADIASEHKIVLRDWYRKKNIS